MCPKKDAEKSTGFSDEERAAMKERAEELKTEARAKGGKKAGESAVLAKIAEMEDTDRAMAERAVRSGPEILVVAALESTLQPTIELIRESAVALGQDVSIRHLVVRDAWQHFMRGDREAYVLAVAVAIRREPIGADDRYRCARERREGTPRPRA